jgi:membrane associated rhomboid family serine protease
VTAVIFSFIIYKPWSWIIVFIVPVPAPIFAILYVAYSYYAARSRQGRVNHEAHLWGAVSGLALLALLAPSAYRNVLQAVGF